MPGKWALIAAFGSLLAGPLEAKKAEPEPPPPTWLENPFDGFDVQAVHAGVGVSEVKPDMDVTRAISRARAAHNLAESLRKKSVVLRRDYATIEDSFSEYTGKGFTVRTIEGFCKVKLLLQDYSSEINEEDEGMIERAMLVEFPSGSSTNVLVQEYTNPAGTSLWTRLVIGAKSAPKGDFQSWRNPYSVKVRDYLNVFASGEEEVYLTVFLSGEETDISWVEDTVSRGKRVGTLQSSGEVSKYKIYGEMEKWVEEQEAVDFSPFIQADASPLEIE